MKKIIAVTLSFLILLFACLPVFAADITAAPTPTEASLLFTKKLGTGYKNAPTPLTFYGGALFVAAGRVLYKLDAATGETLAKTEMESVSTFTAIPPLVAEGKVFITLDDGIVQAFSVQDLSPVWTYTDALGGQGLTPILYADGYLYTGFWNGEADVANFVCLPVSGHGEQNAVWTFSSNGGFYRSAAIIRGDYLVMGSENGERVNVPDAPAKIYALNKHTGALASFVELPGDIRAGIGTAADGACYAVSKEGRMVRFFIDEAKGTLTKNTEISLPGSSTVTPVVYKGRLYAACANGREGLFLVLDANTLQTIYSAELPGVPQGNLLLSTAYEAMGGTVMLYTTYNAPPGGVYLFEDRPGQTQAISLDFFAPAQELSQYCFCPIEAGENGALYYKNDSGTIFALQGVQSSYEGEINCFGRLLFFLRRLISVFRFLTGWTNNE